jgi:P-type Ca2+ transporter type 2C
LLDAASSTEVSSHGLSHEQARALLAQHGPNALPQPNRSGALAQAWKQLVTEPMFLLLLGAALVYVLLGNAAEGALLGVFALTTVGLALWQNQRSRKALDALRALAAPQARVLREGSTQILPASQVVPGDVLLLEEGERVAADAIVQAATALATDESMLTGESLPVDKPAGSRVHMGTLVVAGHGHALVQATGVHTEAGRIGALLNALDDTPTRLQASTARLVRVLGLAAAVLSLGLWGLMVWQGSDAMRALLSAMALAMSLLPEEFALALAVFFAIGAWRLAQVGVLTRRAAVIETLGAATVLAVDKTGTLTENRMRLRETVALDDGEAARNDVLTSAVRASREQGSDPIDRALHDQLQHHRALHDQLQHHRALHALPWAQTLPAQHLWREYPLAAGQPYYAAAWADADGHTTLHCKGAAEALLALCDLPETQATHWRERAATLAARGLRVLGVARTPVQLDVLPDSVAALRLQWLGLIAFEDPLRASVPAAVQQARDAGLRVLMITGDAPGTAIAIAEQAGIDTQHGALLGAQIDALDDAALAQAITRHSVVARVTPQHKLRLVRALQAGGAVVAMTGDGVNDAPALRAAHIGIGMGARGTDVAREAAALVLLDDDFAHIVQGVSLGRRIFDNLRKVMLYIVAIHVPIAGLALLPLLLGWPPLLMPAHVALLEMVIDPMCSLGYEGLPAERDQMKQAPRPLVEALIGMPQLVLAGLQGATVLSASLAVYGLALQEALAEPQARFLGFAALTAGNLMLALVNAGQRPLWRGAHVAKPFVWITLGAAGALMLCLATPWSRALFGFEWSGGVALAVAALAGAAPALVWDAAKVLPAVANTVGLRTARSHS